jgi:hypothetical protein
MDTHISHDLPIAIATTCAELSFAPTVAVFHDDYEKVDQILDAAEQSARESFESGAILTADEHLRSVINLIANWNLNQAREIAWNTALALWEARDLPVARDLLRASLGHAVAATSQLLLAAVCGVDRSRSRVGHRVRQRPAGGGLAIPGRPFG